MLLIFAVRKLPTYLVCHRPAKLKLTPSHMTAGTDKPFASDRLSFPTVQIGLRRAGLHSNAIVDQVNHITGPPKAHQQVIRFEVSMNNAFAMKILETTDELIGKHQYGFQRELAVAESQKILQTWP